MFFIEDKNFLNEENKKFINETILGPFFAYFRQGFSTYDKDNKDSIFTHIILARPEHRIDKNQINSDYYFDIIKILNSFLQKNNIEYTEFLRICVNLTFNNGVEKCPIHFDHSFEHKQIIIYLNDILDKNAKTIILDKNEKIIKEIEPEQYKGICFDKLPHYHFYPKIGERITLIATFR
jgi:hypothetical protein